MKTLEHQEGTSYSRKWLLLPAVAGVALIVYNVRWTATSGTTDRNAVPGVLSDIGVTLLLFSFLFWFEKRIERRIIEGIRILSEGDLDERVSAQDEDPLMPGDFLGDYGPEQTAVTFVEQIEAGNFDNVWLLTCPNLRLCRSQGWIFSNLAGLGLPPDHSPTWDKMAERLVTGPHPNDEVWESFAECEIGQLAESFSDYMGDKAGWSQRRRIVGPRHELVLLTLLPKSAPNGYLVTSPTLIENSRDLLMVCMDHPTSPTGRIYMLAGLGRAAPLPGWPPTWWMIDDPVAVDSHPGLQDDRGG